MFAAVENSAGSVPAFLVKLWTLVEDVSTDNLIEWDPSGTSFHVYDQQNFSREILPLYFKHNNIASFIRQLNMYGFRKVTHIEQGSLKIEKDDLQFQHQYFRKGERDMLQYIKRKVSNQTVRTTDSLTTANPDEISRVLTDVKQIKSKQDAMDHNLEYIKRENKLLWREVATLRQKHHKQQQIVNKLIQFLVSLVSSNRTGLTIPPFRRIPLAIDGIGQLGANSQVITETLSEEDSDVKPHEIAVSTPDRSEETGLGGVPGDYTIESPSMGDLLSPTSINTGPIIHELTESPQTVSLPAARVTIGASASQSVPNSVFTSNQIATGSPAMNNLGKIVMQAPSPSGNRINYVVVPTVDKEATSEQEAVITQPEVASNLLSPKIEAAPSLEDALTYGLNVPSTSNIAAPTFSNPQTQNNAANQKRKRKVSQTGTTGMPPPAKRPTQQQNTVITSVPNSQNSTSQTLDQLVMANMGLDKGTSNREDTAKGDASLAVTASKDTDEFTLSSDQLDMLSSDMDGLKSILHDQYKVDPTFLMELFESANPWPIISEKDLDDLKVDSERDGASTSGEDHGNIIGNELVEYNPRDELFPELMDDNIMADIDDID